MTDDPELSASARAQLDILDECQIGDIIDLAADDWAFRCSLDLATGAAVAERGYRLSEAGLEHLYEILTEYLTEPRGLSTLPTYH